MTETAAHRRHGGRLRAAEGAGALEDDGNELARERSVIASTSYEDFEAMFDHEEFVR